MTENQQNAPQDLLGLVEEDIPRTKTTQVPAKPRTGARRKHRKQPKVVCGFELTDVGNANRFAAKHGEDLLYVPGIGWFCWTKKKWEADGKDALRVMAKAVETAESIRDEAMNYPESEVQALLMKWFLGSQRESRLNSMVNLARHMLSVSVDELDADPYLLNCQNGILDVRTGELLPHDRAAKCTRITMCNYIPGAKAERWEKFITEILPDSKVREFVHRWSGSLLTGETNDQSLLIGVGRGRNGKSVLLNTLGHVLGDHARNVSQEFFIRRPGDPPPKAELAQLPGIRFIWGTELKNNLPLDVAFIKTITGGDPVTAEHKYQPPFVFVPQFKVAMSANQRPRSNDTTDSFWARAKWVPFPINFQELGTLDKSLPEQLKAEVEGILAWMMRGAEKWQREGLGSAPAIDAFGEEERNAQDPLSELFETWTVQEPDATCEKSALYDRYEKWATDDGKRNPGRWLLTVHAFNREMRDRGFREGKDSRTRRAIWRGIRIAGEQFQPPIAGLS